MNTNPRNIIPWLLFGIAVTFYPFLFLIGIFLVGIASLGRLGCSLYIAGRKTKSLITEGLYFITTNPSYFLIGFLGVGFCSETFLIPCILLLAFIVYYSFVIRCEEARLKEVHPKAFEEYVSINFQIFPQDIRHEGAKNLSRKLCNL